jgi:hypothetical protein
MAGHDRTARLPTSPFASSRARHREADRCRPPMRRPPIFESPAPTVAARRTRFRFSVRSTTAALRDWERRPRPHASLGESASRAPGAMRP